ncbi:MAG: cell division protein FtsL, partial [Pseudomonadota bacterium]
MLAVWAALLAAAVASAVGVVYARHESRRLFVELSALEAARDELNIDFGRLQLEQATWADANRIEKIARGEL